MRVLALALTLVVACKGNEGRPIDNTITETKAVTGSQPTPGSAPAPDDPFEKGIAELDALRAKMCACADVPCTEKVFEEFKAWRVELRKGLAGRKPSKEQNTRANDLERKMRACRADVTARPGSAGSATPADPIEAALVQVDAFKTKMCACKDKACADAVQIDYATWQRNLRTKLVARPSKLQEVRGTGLENEMKECRRKAEAGTPGVTGGASKVDAMLAQMQTYRDKICACTARDCATKLAAEMKTWLENVAKDLADAKPTKDQDDKADRLDREMKDCVAKLK